MRLLAFASAAVIVDAARLGAAGPPKPLPTARPPRYLPTPAPSVVPSAAAPDVTPLSITNAADAGADLADYVATNVTAAVAEQAVQLRSFCDEDRNACAKLVAGGAAMGGILAGACFALLCVEWRRKWYLCPCFFVYDAIRALWRCLTCRRCRRGAS